MQRFKRMIPQGAKPFLKKALGPLLMTNEFLRDASRYRQFSSPNDQILPASCSDRTLEAQLTKDYHRVEKALALNDPRRPFGKAVHKRLEAHLSHDKNELSAHHQYASDALEALNDWNNEGIRDTKATVSSSELPTFDIPDEEFAHFFASRRSLRHFDQEKRVDRSTLEEAVSLARNTPSVCNRQAWKVRFYRGNEVPRLAKYQNGNSGFGPDAPVLAIITMDIRLFTGAGERNQAWIDGGLFSMSLGWALHSMGLSLCMLNWSMPNRQSAALRKAANIPESELIVMMMAIGYAPEEYRVARSERRDIEEISQFVGEWS